MKTKNISYFEDIIEDHRACFKDLQFLLGNFVFRFVHLKSAQVQNVFE